MKSSASRKIKYYKYNSNALYDLQGIPHPQSYPQS